jgi:hypothetical protein
MKTTNVRYITFKELARGDYFYMSATSDGLHGMGEMYMKTGYNTAADAAGDSSFMFDGEIVWTEE